MRRLHAIVRGRVQGVSFRAATASEARRLGVHGWVRNLSDGNVEVVAEGEEGALKKLEAFLRVGPPAAAVQEVEVAWPGPAGDLSSFSIRH